MQYRRLGKTNYHISAISFGAWAIGSSWGKTDDTESLKALHTAAEAGVNFIDTADVYGDGHSEKLIAKFLKAHKGERIYVATKAGRRLNPHVAEAYTGKNIEKFIDRSLKNLQVESLDLLQLHCPPTQVYYQPELFEYLDTLVVKGKIGHYGVSVEKVEEAIKAIHYPGVATVQIIFNMFRQRPAELFFQLAHEFDIGVITRVPLASGLLTGKFTKTSQFAKDDHRNFNRQGQAFDKGETFAGIDYDTGLAVVKKLKSLKPDSMTLPQFALRWILMFPEVACAIPGAKTPQQVLDNTQAANFPELDVRTMEQIEELYYQYFYKTTHHQW